MTDCSSGRREGIAAASESQRPQQGTNGGTTPASPVPLTVESFDYISLHSPYNKLVQKGFARYLACSIAALSHARNMSCSAFPV